MAADSTTTASSTAGGNVNSTAIGLFAGRAKDVAGNLFKERKPWGELFDRTAFSRPTNLAEATSRLRKNAAYFRVNYIIISLMSTAVSLVLHPNSLFVIAFLLMAWVYFFIVRTAPVVIGGRTFNEREKFVGLSVISVIIIFFLTSVGTVLFSALGFSLLAIAVHGACRVPDDLFTDDVEGGGGFLSLLTGTQVAGANNV